ncbi:MAG TPA: hypothetical protein VER17_12675 [Tepidisphaeraceae bacterium]|nr:hypothetical protein [Tepidisphaeraceae bacterium]
MADDPLNYAASSARRSAGTWAKLVAVYAAGVVSWTIYLVALVYLLSKIL